MTSADTDLAMDIGQVARQSGLPASTLRYYEEKGLIRSIGRSGLRRVFAGSILERLSFIALGRHAGFSLEEIAEMFAPDGGLAVDRGKLVEKAEDLDKRIRQLTAMRDGLRHAAKCDAPSHLECPKFLRLMRMAGKRPVRGKKE